MCLGGFCLHFCLGGLLFVISAMCDESTGSDDHDRDRTVILYPENARFAWGIFGYLKYVTIFSMYLADDVIDGGMFLYRNIRY